MLHGVEGGYVDPDHPDPLVDGDRHGDMYVDPDHPDPVVDGHRRGEKIIA